MITFKRKSGVIFWCIYTLIAEGILFDLEALDHIKQSIIKDSRGST